MRKYHGRLTVHLTNFPCKGCVERVNLRTACNEETTILLDVNGENKEREACNEETTILLDVNGENKECDFHNVK